LLALIPFAAPADEPEAVDFGIVDPTFSPLLGGQRAGSLLQRVPSPSSDVIRWAETRRSIARVADLGGNRRLVQLVGFGRKVERELNAALLSTDELILDLRANRGGSVRRMLRVAGRFTGPVAGALRLVGDDQVGLVAIPDAGPVWRGHLTVLVGGQTISSGEVLAALLRRHAGALVLGARSWGKDYVMRVEPLSQDWRALVPDARIEVPGERLAGGLLPDGPIPAALADEIVAP
jgi:C-terminal processing protease CtpA/Prc